MKTLSIADRNLDKNASTISTENLTKWAEIMDETMETLISSFNEGTQEDASQNSDPFYIGQHTKYCDDENSLMGSVISSSGEVVDVSLYLAPEEQSDGLLLSIFAGYDETLISKEEPAIEGILRDFISNTLVSIFR